MRHLTLAIASIAALAVAAPASAAVVLTPTFGVTGNSSLSGTAGNIRSWTYSDGSGHSVGVKVRAFSISTTNSVNTTTNQINSGSDNKCAIGSSTFNSANCITKSFLGDYGQGLGATSVGDGTANNAGVWSGASNTHTIDNVGAQDFIILQFDRKVKLISATFSPFAVSGSTDSDATIGVRNLANQSDLGPNAAINLTTRASLNALIGTQYERDSSLGNTNRALDPNNYVGRLWLIAASLQTSNQRYYDNKKDGYKLKDIKVQTVGAVPEPANWALMIAGFGLIGGAMRRKSRATLQAA
jgi:PEP-CTERM motif